MKLPTEFIEPLTINPRILILFGKPKCGKTSALAQLEDNLLIDLEKGSDFVRALKVNVNNLEELKDLKQSLQESKHKYKYITFDTATKLEEIVLPLALAKYKTTPQGKNTTVRDVRHIANGLGYLFLRESYKEVIDGFREFADCLILLGHVKDKQITNKDGDYTELTLDLSGKLANIMTANSDALGYVYRKDNLTLVDFTTTGTLVAGARVEHLRGKTITLTESDENGVLTTHWDRIFK